MSLTALIANPSYVWRVRACAACRSGSTRRPSGYNVPVDRRPRIGLGGQYACRLAPSARYKGYLLRRLDRLL
jgi:hypothetical protein